MTTVMIRTTMRVNRDTPAIPLFSNKTDRISFSNRVEIPFKAEILNFTLAFRAAWLLMLRDTWELLCPRKRFRRRIAYLVGGCRYGYSVESIRMKLVLIFWRLHSNRWRLVPKILCYYVSNCRTGIAVDFQEPPATSARKSDIREPQQDLLCRSHQE